MVGQRFCFLLLLVGLSVPAAFCWHDHEYYINKYHKTSSSTEAPLTTEDASSEEKTSIQEGSLLTGHNANGTVLQGDSYNNDFQYVFITRIVIIIGSVILFVVVLGCIVFCCPKCCRGRERRGFIIGDNREATGAQPQQPLVSQQAQQRDVIVQHYPPNYTQEQNQQFPAPYDQQLLAQYQHQQYSPGHPQPYTSPTALQFYNPPEAPPPYEEKPAHKY